MGGARRQEKSNPESLVEKKSLFAGRRSFRPQPGSRPKRPVPSFRSRCRMPFAELRRVVVTGLGVVSPNGHDRESFRQANRDGVSGVRRIEEFSTTAQCGSRADQGAGATRGPEAQQLPASADGPLAILAARQLKTRGAESLDRRPTAVVLLGSGGVGGAGTSSDVRRYSPNPRGGQHLQHRRHAWQQRLEVRSSGLRGLVTSLLCTEYRQNKYAISAISAAISSGLPVAEAPIALEIMTGSMMKILFALERRPPQHRLQSRRDGFVLGRSLDAHHRKCGMPRPRGEGLR